ncbi:AraC family transcriptional regulator [Flagellimonas sp.]|uniref:AraC family transcriptional regulator n=1 Tax=Flagellimonas sp. TaxID=2058762 RepID=UPI003B5A08EA
MKVYAFKIPKKPKENIVVQRDKGPVFFDKLHQHEEIQISQIINGKGKLIVGDSIHSFENGDFFVIGGGIPHLFKSIEGDGDSHMVSLFFTKNSFGPSFFENQEMYELRSFFTLSEAGFKLVSKNSMVQNYMEDIISMDDFSKFICFLQLLKEVNTLKKIKLSNFVHPKEISNDHGERLRSVFDFVMKNFSQKIELDTVSELAHMTPNAFCRFFKQRTNKTFFKFLIEVRVEHSCQLLLHNKDLSVVDVANLSGFNSISNFNRKFKEIKGINPLKFAKQLN